MTVFVVTTGNIIIILIIYCW